MNLNRDSNSDLQISSLVLRHWAVLVLIPIHLQTLLLNCLQLLQDYMIKIPWLRTTFKIGFKISEKILLNQIIKCFNQIISENKPYNLRLYILHFINFKRKIWTWTGIQTRTPDFDLFNTVVRLMINRCQLVSWAIQTCRSGRCFKRRIWRWIGIRTRTAQC